MEGNTRKMIPAVHVKEEPLWQDQDYTSEAGLYDEVKDQLRLHEVEVKDELKSPAAARHETMQVEAQRELISFECSQTYPVGFTLGAHAKDVVIKEEFKPIKEEPEVTTSTCLAAARSGLYAGHKVKDELVLGPECLLKPNNAFLCDVLDYEQPVNSVVPYFEASECIVNSATPHIEAGKCQYGDTDPFASVCDAMKCVPHVPECSVRLERLADHEAVLRAHRCRLAHKQQLQVLTHVALNRVACGWEPRAPPPPLPLRGWRPPAPPRPPRRGHPAPSRRAPPPSAPLLETVGMQPHLIRKDEVAYCFLSTNKSVKPASTTKTKKRKNEPVKRCVKPATTTTKTKKRKNVKCNKCGWLKCNRSQQPRLTCNTCRVKFHHISEFRTHKATRCASESETEGRELEGGREVFGVKFVRGTFVVTCRKK